MNEGFSEAFGVDITCSPGVSRYYSLQGVFAIWVDIDWNQTRLFSNDE